MAERFVLDCSVAMNWCFADEPEPYAEGVLGYLGTHEAIVPYIWTLEVPNVLLVGERRKRITPDGSARFLAMLRSLPIRTMPVFGSFPSEGLLSLAREYSLSVYDACYLELGMREMCPVATLDMKLREAARKRRLGVFGLRGD